MHPILYLGILGCAGLSMLLLCIFSMDAGPCIAASVGHNLEFLPFHPNAGGVLGRFLCLLMVYLKWKINVVMALIKRSTNQPVVLHHPSHTCRGQNHESEVIEISMMSQKCYLNHHPPKWRLYHINQTSSSTDHQVAICFSVGPMIS